MNTLITGRIYHVVDKTTGEIVKVGSTIRAAEQRFKQVDYRKKYTNHFVQEVKTLHSSELDYYEKRNPYCPFLWHLVASEHLEILKQGTFRKSELSNWASPLDQKYFGFDGSLGGLIGGRIGGKKASIKNVASGQWDKARNSPKAKAHSIELAHKNAESGSMAALGRKYGPIYGRKFGPIYGPIYGRKAVESGQLAKIQQAPKTEVQLKRSSELGKIQGQKMADSGELAKIRNLPQSIEAWKNAPRLGGLVSGPINGRKAVENKTGIHADGFDRVAAARKAGAIAAETGQINRIKTKDSCFRGGKTQGKRAVESGQWEEIKGMGLHTRWHTKESRCGRSDKIINPKPNPRCVFCSEQNLVIAYA